MITSGQVLYNHRYGTLNVLEVKNGFIYVDNGASDVRPHRWLEKDFGKLIHPSKKDAILNNSESEAFQSKVLPIDASLMANELLETVQEVINTDRFIKSERIAIQKERNELKELSKREDNTLLSKGFLLNDTPLDSQIESLLKSREKEEHNPDALSEFSKDLRNTVMNYLASKKSIEDRGLQLDKRQNQLVEKEILIKEYSKVFDPQYMDISKL